MYIGPAGFEQRYFTNPEKNPPRFIYQTWENIVREYKQINLSMGMEIVPLIEILEIT